MSKVMRALRMLALATVLVCLTAVPALAKDYTYTVRVFGGNQGSVKGKSTYVVSKDFAYGDSCTLSRDWVKVKDDKYYVKGFRISGRDELCKESFKVTEDTDIVVAYGVKGNMVEYTINFVEYGTGKALKSDSGATSLTLKGNVGDKPVVAAAYVPGYRPLYENITGTLKEEGNSWNLEYVKVTTEETRTSTSTSTTRPTTTRTTVTDEGTTVQRNTTTTTTTTQNSATNDNAETTDEGADDQTTDDTTETTTQTQDQEPEETTVTTEPAAPETQEIYDVDNPLAGPSNSTSDNSAHESEAPKSGLAAAISNPVVIGVMAAGLAALAAATFVAIKRRRG